MTKKKKRNFIVTFFSVIGNLLLDIFEIAIDIITDVLD
jgi:hypothetical protein